MKTRTILSALLAAAMGTASIMPAAAAPMLGGQGASAQSDVIKVDGRRFYRRGDHAYYRGHRGYRHHRRGYREYNGFWFPPAAFALGVIIGQAAQQPTYRVPYNAAHYQWCENRYRSYRVYDNSFQPYHGPRQQCYSPYN